jgi:acyl transferase domain-containing protein
MSMGFPQGITSHEALWTTMMEKRSTASDFPESRMNINGMYHPDPERRGQVGW